MFTGISKNHDEKLVEKISIAKDLAKKHNIKVYAIQIILFQDGGNQVELYHNADDYRISILITNQGV